MKIILIIIVSAIFAGLLLVSICVIAATMAIASDYTNFNHGEAEITYNIFKEMANLASQDPDKYYIDMGTYCLRFGIKYGKAKAYGFKRLKDYIQYRTYINNSAKGEKTQKELDALSELGDILRQGQRQAEQEANQIAEQIIKDYLSRTDK